METEVVSYFHTDTARVFTHDGISNVRIIRIQDKQLWGFRSCGQLNNRIYRGKKWQLEGDNRYIGLFCLGGDYHQWEREGYSNLG